MGNSIANMKNENYKIVYDNPNYGEKKPRTYVSGFESDQMALANAKILAEQGTFEVSRQVGGKWESIK